jgi:hypothetical protein
MIYLNNSLDWRTAGVGGSLLKHITVSSPYI